MIFRKLLIKHKNKGHQNQKYFHLIIQLITLFFKKLIRIKSINPI